VQTGDQVTINGFIVKGGAPKKILTRAVGPSLEVNHQPVPGRLLNPTLELRDGSGALIFFNDDWTTSPQKTDIQASGLAPRDSREPAIIATLPQGAYTTIVRGKSNTTGIALGEIYGLPPSNASELINLSARALTRTGDNVLIDGLIIGGKTSKQIVLRAIGPELRARGVTGELRDPILDLYDANGTILRSNDNWRDAPNMTKIQASGLAPTDNRESAILMTLAPGNYTAIVRGANGTTGIALAEVYMLK
jgi:hypothetical protein